MATALLPLIEYKKQCSKCKEIKPFDDFYANKSAPDGLKVWCKRCHNISVLQSRRGLLKKKIKTVPQGQKWCSKCRKTKPFPMFSKNVCQKDGYQAWCKSCKAHKQRLYYSTEHGRALCNNLALMRSRRPDVAVDIRNRQRVYYLKKINSDPRAMLDHKSKFALREILHGRNSKCAKEFLAVVGYSASELCMHIESLFKPGMSWANYGKDGWHIDHIIPIFAWKYRTNRGKSFKKCWHYTNLQPLWPEENRAKGIQLKLSQ